ncbi:MAG TPA: hypothetical protein VEI54_06505 [Candidatus Limnocylindrales bacterium]|nr:hypothetical protein [Candidatus Limnocylindrales bacterium]
MRRVIGIVFVIALTLMGTMQVAKAQTGPLWTIQKAERQVLVDDIAHYQFVVAVGPGQYDKIRVHRVVRETQPYQPERLSQAILFVAGEPTYFTLYLEPTISKATPRDHAIAIYLAKNGIDVWGMDYRWALVPEDTTDFNFMKEWGAKTDVEDTQTALTIARWIRGGPFGPEGPLYLAGLSYGAQITYAVAANDTQRPAKLRNVKGIVPMDYGVLFNDADYQAENCGYLPDILSGPIYSDNRVYWQIGQLALSNPNDLSPFDDTQTYTNYQFALGVGAWPNESIAWHFVGGWFDQNGTPYDLRYTTPRLFLDLLIHNEPPYYPTLIDYETGSVVCAGKVADDSYAGHLGEVKVPILYVGAAGGIGRYGEYTTTVTASKDVTIHIVQVQPDDMRAVDYGHADLLTARDADSLVWQPILNWLKAHR